MKWQFGRHVAGIGPLGMVLLIASLCALPALGADQDDLDLWNLSLEELMNIEITSVSKQAESLLEAPAAVSVLTADDIRRSGHTSVPELLRMVPGLQVARIDSNRWAISSRGFAGLLASKLLVLIDGRSVYSPTSSGVYWDAQDVRIEDIERIEVIRGPGGTLWGANAVNGVINIITKEAGDTQGAELDATFGRVGSGDDSFEGIFGGRWGGSIGDDFAYRLHARATNRAALEDADGNNANDGWNLYRGGFRTDWDFSDRDRLTVEADAYKGEGSTESPNPLDMSGAHLLARWTRQWSERSSTKVQVYYDYMDREQGTRILVHTGDFEFQHDLNFGSDNPFSLAWGANYRLTRDHLTPGLFAPPDVLVITSFDPERETQHMASAFGQGRLDFLDDRLTLLLGIKLGYNSFNDFEWQPSLRVRATPWEDHNFWIAVSRAIRAPARTDRDLAMTLGGFLPLVYGNSDFKSEKLIAFEQGYRGAILPELTFALSGFQFLYDDLHTTLDLGTFPPSYSVQNGMEAESYGLEAELAWDAEKLLDLLPGIPIERLRLSSAYSLIYIDGDIDGAPLDAAPEHAEGTTPKHQVQFRGLIDFPYDVELDVLGYWVDKLDGPPAAINPVDSYFRLDVRAGWKPCDNLELSVVGQNLTRRRHEEFNLFMDTNSGAITPVVENVPRSVLGKVTLSF